MELFRTREILTDPHYGKEPSKRNIDELLKNGLIIIDKPRGPTSHYIANLISKMLGVKAGHLGTLDPDVSGVLPILIGKARKATHYLIKHDKEYVGLAEFNKFNENEIKKIKKAFKSFIGEITQIPPIGAAVARKPRKRNIYSIEILEIDRKRKYVLFKVNCEAGTYIRTLVEDIGKSINNDGKLIELRRTKVGDIDENKAVNLYRFADAFFLWKEKKEERELKKILRPLEEIVNFKKIWISDGAVNSVCSGSPLMVPGIIKLEDKIKNGEIVAIYTLKDELVGFGEARMNSDEIIRNKKGIAVKTSRVMMERGIYPKWKPGSHNLVVR